MQYYLIAAEPYRVVFVKSIIACYVIQTDIVLTIGKLNEKVAPLLIYVIISALSFCYCVRL
jgi:hypothetical protein